MCGQIQAKRIPVGQLSSGNNYFSCQIRYKIAGITKESAFDGHVDLAGAGIRRDIEGNRDFHFRGVGDEKAIAYRMADALGVNIHCVVDAGNTNRVAKQFGKINPKHLAVEIFIQRKLIQCQRHNMTIGVERDGRIEITRHIDD